VRAPLAAFAPAQAHVLEPARRVSKARSAQVGHRDTRVAVLARRRRRATSGTSERTYPENHCDRPTHDPPRLRSTGDRVTDIPTMRTSRLCRCAARRGLKSKALRGGTSRGATCSWRRANALASADAIGVG
jgi:hypothetical protein